MDALAKLRHLGLVNRVTVELDNHLGVDDKDLAEFLVDLATTSPDVETFGKRIAEEGGGEPFPGALVSSIFRAVPRSKISSRAGPSTSACGTTAPSLSITGSTRPGSSTAQLSETASAEQVARQEKADRVAALYPALAGGAVAKTDNASRGVGDERAASAGLRADDDTGDAGGDGYDADGGFLGSGIDRRRVLKRSADEEAEQEAKFGLKRLSATADGVNAGPRSKGPPSRSSAQELAPGAVVRGSVTNIRDFGAFVSLKPGSEGLVHVSQMRSGATRVESPQDVLRRGQQVWVKILSVSAGRIALSIRDIDQESGRDLSPESSAPQPRTSAAAPPNDADDAEWYRRKRRRERGDDPYEPGGFTGGRGRGGAGSVSGIPSSFLEDEHGGSARDGAALGSRGNGGRLGHNQRGRMRRQLPETEKWELQQLAKAGVMSYKELRRQAGALSDDDEENDTDGGRGVGKHVGLGDDDLDDGVAGVEIELNEDDPAFLRAADAGGASTRNQPLSPVRIVKNPDGSMQRAAMTQSALAKERREARDEHRAALENQMPDDLNRAWEDPVARERHVAAELRGAVAGPSEIPEWKKQAMGAAPSFGFAQKQDRSIAEQRASLPIAKLKNELLTAFRENQVLVIIGETGSGKTTQMTQYLAEAGYTLDNKRIGCTQPRRVAAISVAKRVAEEMGCRLGEEVGYSIRFEDMTSAETQIKYMTDGMLLREALTEPDLNNYSVVMIDEAHERTISTDVLFGLLKSCVKRRRDLKLICTSATLDAEKFSSYFDNCPIFTIPGRSFPVDIMYAKEPVVDYMDEALITVMQIHLHEPPGDVLLFLTGQEEIDTAAEILFERMRSLGSSVPELIILPVYSALPSEMQTRIFDPAPPGSRKVVIATNIAEASLTIDGIYYVVDPGFAKQKVYNPKLGMDSLIVAPISQASARQRSGRAGRTGPGKAFRMYTESAFSNEMLPTSVPELQRSNLSHTVLTLKAMGINDLLHFDFMDPPPAPHLISAMESLYALGALDEEGLLTKLGRIMSQFPLDPMVSKMLLASVDLGCSEEILTIVAMLSVTSIFYRPKEKQGAADQKKAKFHQPEGDHLTLLAVYDAWKRNRFSNPWCYENFIQSRSLKHAQDVRKQLITIMDRYKLDIVSAGRNYVKVRKAIVSGFFAHAAKKDPQEGYRTLTDGQPVYIHPSSSLFHLQPEWVLYHEVVLTTKEYMREVMAIESSWLVELAPRFFRVADPNKISRRKKKERIEPLFDKYATNQDDWRLSRRKNV
jgi:ATP-dependent RNA helicase DHX8/PRP22